MSTYIPEPIDTSAIELPPDLLELTEQIGVPVSRSYKSVLMGKLK